MVYPAFRAAGWPIGSGSVERANKLVVEARLKGAGMHLHWARDNVNALLALRNTVCNDRWDATWPQITQQLREQRVNRQRARRAQRQSAAAPAVSTVPEPDTAPRAPAAAEPELPPPAAAPAPEPTDKPGHPWKRPWSRRRQRESANASE